MLTKISKGIRKRGRMIVSIIATITIILGIFFVWRYMNRLHITEDTISKIAIKMTGPIPGGRGSNLEVTVTGEDNIHIIVDTIEKVYNKDIQVDNELTMASTQYDFTIHNKDGSTKEYTIDARTSLECKELLKVIYSTEVAKQIQDDENIQ